MRSLCLVTAFCLLFAPVGCKRKSSGNAVANKAALPSYASPQAAFDAFQAAAEQDDFAGAIAVTTIETQQAVAGSLVFALGMVAALDQQNGPEIEKLLKEHGISEDGPAGPPPDIKLDGPAAMVRVIGSSVKDPLAFIGAAMKFMDDDDDQSMNFAGGQLGPVAIDGDHASAMLTINDDEKPIEFVKTGSGWLIHIPDDEFSMGDNEGVQISGGNDFDEFDFHHDPHQELPPPDAITRAEFDNAWKTSVDFQDRVAAEVLTEVLAQSGFKLFDQPQMVEKLQQKVTVKLDNVSRLQVIETICQQVGVYPRYKAKTMAFAEGPRPHPVAFAGPFMVAVKNVDEHVPYAAGQIEFVFVAAGIPMATAAQISALRGIADDDSDSAMTVNIPNIQGGGQELLGQNSGGAMKTASPSTVVFGLDYKLKNLLKDVEAIDPIQGRLSWPFPSKITKIKFDEIKQGAVAEGGDIKLTLKKVQLGPMSEFTVNVEGAEYDEVAIVGRDANGKPLNNNFSSASGFSGTARVQISVNGRPKSLEARIDAESDRVSYDFTIPAVALSSYAEMPEQLTETKFDGEQPVSVKFLKLTGNKGFRKVKLSVSNHTNKDIHLLQIRFDYLDANGKVLKQGNASAMGSRVLIKAGHTDDVEVNAFFMPEEATSASGKPEWIEFADATEWRAEK